MKTGVAILFVLIIMAVIIVRVRRRKKKKREENYQLERKERENELENSIRNPLNGREISVACNPYHVNYSEGGKNHQEQTYGMFRIIEKTNRAERKYLFTETEVVYNGDRNGIPVVMRAETDRKIYCRISCSQKTYYIKSMGTERITVQRKKDFAEIDEKGVVLQSEDIVHVLNTEYVFQILNRHGKYR